jgi:prevent-host-death family protein
MSIAVNATDANQRFAELLGKAAAGETVIITKRGQPVAQLMPYRPEAASPERKAAWDDLLAMLKRGLRSGLSDAEFRAWKWNREELYEDRSSGHRG